MYSRVKNMSNPGSPSSSLKHVVVGLACCVVILGAAMAWVLFQNQELASAYGSLNVRYGALNESRSALQQDFADLFDEYSSLSTEYGRLQAEYDAQEGRYGSLAGNYASLSSLYRGLGGEVSGLADLLGSFSSFPEAIGRTLTEAEIVEVDWAVEYALGGETDPWAADTLIYAYINDNIAYQRDIDMPAIKNLTTSTLAGADYITGFSIDYSREYMATPSLTLFNGYGDCDDQAILGYAMIKYFERHVTGQQYDLYLSLITFDDGAMHLCLIRPATDGYAFVLDPAGGYISPGYGSENATKAQGSLAAYSDYWIANGGIGRMVLYQVTDYNGNYVMAVNGTVDEVASFLG